MNVSPYTIIVMTELHDDKYDAGQEIFVHSKHNQEDER